MTTHVLHSLDQPTLLDGIETLDRLDHALAAGANVFEQMDTFLVDMLALRTQLGPDWRNFATEHFHHHPVRKTIHQSPFSRRSYEQPRGYAGDAATLDYIYGLTPVREVSRFGRALFDWEYQTEACRCVRERRDLLAKTIDDVAATRPESRILSVACGLLREAELSDAVRDGAVREFYALDQDEESIACLRDRWPAGPVSPISGSVRSILAGKHQFHGLDFVYSAGLYDYLSEPVAKRLTAKMFSMLRSGGRLLVANFHPDLADIGGLETMMRWWLIYRDEDEVARLSDEIDPHQIASQRVYRDHLGNIAYLDLTRA